MRQTGAGRTAHGSLNAYGKQKNGACVAARRAVGMAGEAACQAARFTRPEMLPVPADSSYQTTRFDY
ncbi:hypothetical protein PT2222_260039 [Paraburkholderia tropica]